MFDHIPYIYEVYPSMDPNVNLQVANMQKYLITFLTLMSFLTSMDLNVFLQVATCENV